MRGALREAEEGRRKAEVEAAQLKVEVEAQRRRGDDLQQRRGFAEAQVRTLTSTWCSIHASCLPPRDRHHEPSRPFA